MKASEVFRQAFSIKDVVFLNNAAISPLPVAAVQAIKGCLEKLEGTIHFDHPSVFRVVEECRSEISKLINFNKDRITLTPNTATAISQVALGMNWKSGDKILLWDQEYPSNAYPWIEATKRHGAVLDILQSEADLSMNHEELLDKIRPGVRVVALSWVQFQSGVTSPLEVISAACRKVGAWLIVDGIQGLGAIPFDFKKSGVHALCGGSHKWLSGPLGSGFLAMDDELFAELKPLAIGANTYNAIGLPFSTSAATFEDARRFEPGAPSLFNLFGWTESLKLYNQVGVASVHEQALSLSHFLLEELRSLGFTPVGEQNPQKRISPILTVRPSRGQDPQKYYSALAAKKIAHSPRAGGIRFSPHGFNTLQECQLAVDVIKKA